MAVLLANSFGNMSKTIGTLLVDELLTWCGTTALHPYGGVEDMILCVTFGKNKTKKTNKRQPTYKETEFRVAEAKSFCECFHAWGQSGPSFQAMHD